MKELSSSSEVDRVNTSYMIKNLTGETLLIKTRNMDHYKPINDGHELTLGIE